MNPAFFTSCAESEAPTSNLSMICDACAELYADEPAPASAIDEGRAG